jgi:hypothetical protein
MVNLEATPETANPLDSLSVSSAPIPIASPPEANRPVFTSTVDAKGEFKHIVRGPLTAEKAWKYAKLLQECMVNGAGKTRLRLLNQNGQELDWSPEPVMVNEQQFYWLAGHYGLV